MYEGQKLKINCLKSKYDPWQKGETLPILCFLIKFSQSLALGGFKVFQKTKNWKLL